MKKLFFISILILLVCSCSTIGNVQQNYAHLYKSTGQLADPDYIIYHHNSDSSKVFFKIESSKIKKLITTDTIDNSKKIGKSKKIEIISLAPIISEAMKRIANSTSVSSLFK